MISKPLKPESLLLIGAFLTGAAFLSWLLKRGHVSEPMLPPAEPDIREPTIVFPIEGMTIPRTGLIRSFGYQRTPTHIHQGIDMSAPTGTPVYAARKGKVTHANTTVKRGFSGYGRIIVIEVEPTEVTPPLWFLYAHLDEVFVEVGQTVETGKRIGTVGRTCFERDEPTRLCKGSHLHFEVSPRPYHQDSEAWRYDPGQALMAIYTNIEPTSWNTT